MKNSWNLEQMMNSWELPWILSCTIFHRSWQSIVFLWFSCSLHIDWYLLLFIITRQILSLNSSETRDWFQKWMKCKSWRCKNIGSRFLAHSSLRIMDCHVNRNSCWCWTGKRSAKKKEEFSFPRLKNDGQGLKITSYRFWFLYEFRKL